MDAIAFVIFWGAVRYLARSCTGLIGASKLKAADEPQRVPTNPFRDGRDARFWAEQHGYTEKIAKQDSELQQKDLELSELRTALADERHAHADTQRLLKRGPFMTISFVCLFIGVIVGAYTMLFVIVFTSYIDAEPAAPRYLSEAPDAAVRSSDADAVDTGQTPFANDPFANPAEMPIILRCPRSFVLLDQEFSLTESTMRFHSWHVAPSHGWSRRPATVLLLMDRGVR